MHTQRQAAAHKASQQQNRTDAELEFVDKRVETVSLRQLQETADYSSQSQGLAQLKALMDKSPRSATMKNLQAMFKKSPRQAAQRQLHSGVQGSPVGLQAGSDNLSVQLTQRSDAKSNNTGLPDNLKAGVEFLSGMSLDNVKVHYNSSDPAQLNAHAFAQGEDIHLEPGQEQHLPHEAWHVVQQAQGRVKPTMQMKNGGFSVNDDQGLEREADLMGGKLSSAGAVQTKQESYNSIESDPVDL